MRESLLTLPDGRRLAYAEFGDAGGRPLVYCHGFPGSRLEASFADTVAARAGLRLVSIDRPGMGGSDYLPGRTLLDWPVDVGAVADHLELERFDVIGVSGGAPYALACASVLSGRVRSATVVSGVGPPEAIRTAPVLTTSGLGLRVIGSAPWAASFACFAARVLARHALPLTFALIAAPAPAPDRRMLREAGFRSFLGASLREAFRRGVRGPARDLRLLSAPWLLEIAGIRTPVRIWHGEDDRVVPVSMGRFLARELPNCRAVMVGGEGHYSLIGGHADEILAAVAEQP